MSAAGLAELGLTLPPTPVSTVPRAQARLDGRVQFGPKHNPLPEPTEYLDPTAHNVRPCEGVSHNERVYEQPWHKGAIMMLACGIPTGQVAESLGLCESTVRDAYHTAWFQAKIASVVEKNGGKDMIESFRRDAEEAHELLVEIRRNEKTPVGHRIKLATDAVERAWGKATQRVEHGEIKSANPADEVARLEREIKIMREGAGPSLS